MLIPILLLPLLRSLLTFLTFLRMRHKGLFIIASDIIESHFVDLDRISGHFFYVFYDNLVIRMFLIVLVALGARLSTVRETTWGFFSSARRRIIRSTYLP